MKTQREIKFRCWDKDSKNNPGVYKNINPMYYDIQYTYDNDLGDHKPGESSFGDILNNPRYEVMQFTGLFDKRGQEIWEGDIVKHKWGIDAVEFWHGAWQGRSIKAIQCNRHLAPIGRIYSSSKHMEVIGNIWENKERK